MQQVNDPTQRCTRTAGSSFLQSGPAEIRLLRRSERSRRPSFEPESRGRSRVPNRGQRIATSLSSTVSRLPPSANRRPPPANICHDLPGPASGIRPTLSQATWPFWAVKSKCAIDLQAGPTVTVSPTLNGQQPSVPIIDLETGTNPIVGMSPSATLRKQEPNSRAELVNLALATGRSNRKPE